MSGKVHVATHPLIAHKITVLRDKNTAPQQFRSILQEITYYLGYEATREMTLAAHPIETPNGATTGHKINQSISLIPILRAGLGMTDGMLNLVPNASIHHIGMYRSRDSLLPVQYYNKLPRGQHCDIAYIFDPCIATSATLSAAISIVKKWGAGKIVVVAAIGAQSGVDEVTRKHPDVDIYIAAVDPDLSEDGIILPGLGDAGDRQFGTPDEHVASSASPSKRPASSGNKRGRN
jgi:uracil phosphoribosyltransferase